MRKNTISRYVVVVATVVGVAMAGAGALTAADANDFRLLDAAKSEDAQAIRSLVEQGVPVNVKRADGVTPLSLACGNGSSPLVMKLLEAGANPKSAQMSGETALMTCSRTNAVEAVEALIARGADVNAKEKCLGQTALMWSASEGHAGVVQILLKHGADVHARSADGYTAFLLAARGADMPTAQALMAGGADVNEKAKDGTTALVVAIIRGHAKYVEFLLDKDANPNLGPGFTPLHWAAAKFDHQLSDKSNGILSDNTEWSSFGGLRSPEQQLEVVKALIAH